MTKGQEWIWYSVSCSYWTDNFDDLTNDLTANGLSIPCCPRCGMVGYQIELDMWNEGLEKYDKEEPGYKDFINEIKKTCNGPDVTVIKLWEKHKKDQTIH